MDRCRVFLAGLVLMVCIAIPASAQIEFRDITITPLGHASVMIQYQGKTIITDPIEDVDYSKLPQADLVLITHHHSDHFAAKPMKQILVKETLVIGSPEVIKILKSGTSLTNGKEHKWGSIVIKAVPAYNIVGKRGNGEPFHPKGRDNGYLITMGENSVYVAGDTELIPEMKELSGKVDVAVMPISKPYTMDEKACAEAAKLIKPKLLIPYHFFDADPNKVKEYLKETDIQVKF